MSTRYTRSELVTDAQRAGYNVTPKLIERWVTAGLLDQATTEGRSRGTGVGRTWPASQRDLLLALLGQHRNTRLLRTLLNIPVWVWLTAGDDFVPTHQTKRAMETWIRGVGRRRSFQARVWAVGVVRRLAIRGGPAGARNVLVDELESWAATGVVNEAEVRRLLDKVVGLPDPRAQTDGARAFHLINDQIVLVRRWGELTLAHFEWARAFHLFGLAEYAKSRDVLAADPRFGKLHEPFDFEHLVPKACADLSSVLSLALRPGATSTSLPEQVRLDVWLAGRAHLRVRSGHPRGGLWTPEGERGHLPIEWDITLDRA